MNSNQQFDEHIKEQFNNYSPDVHPRIWENIIATKEKRKPVGFWVSIFNRSNRLLFIGLLITISSGGALFYFSKYTNTDNTQTDVENNKNNITNQEAATILIEKNNSTDANNTALNADQALSLPGAAKVSIYSPSISSDGEENTTINNNSGNKKRYKELGGLLNTVYMPSSKSLY